MRKGKWELCGEGGEEIREGEGKNHAGVWILASSPRARVCGCAVCLLHTGAWPRGQIGLALQALFNLLSLAAGPKGISTKGISFSNFYKEPTWAGSLPAHFWIKIMTSREMEIIRYD